MTTAHASTIRRYRPRYQAPEDLLTSSTVAKRWSRTNSAVTTPNRSPPQNDSPADEPEPVLEWSAIQSHTPSAQRFAEQTVVGGTPRTTLPSHGPIATPEWMKSFQDSGGLVEVTPRRRVQQSLMTCTAASSHGAAALSTPSLDRRRASAVTPRQTTMMFGVDFEDVARRRQALFMAEEGNRILNAANAHARRGSPSANRGASTAANPVTFIDVLSRKKARERQMQPAAADQGTTSAAQRAGPIASPAAVRAGPLTASVDASRPVHRPQGVAARVNTSTTAATMLRQYLDMVAVKSVSSGTEATSVEAIADASTPVDLVAVQTLDDRSRNVAEPPAHSDDVVPLAADGETLSPGNGTPMPSEAALVQPYSPQNAAVQQGEDTATVECQEAASSATLLAETEDVPRGVAELRDYIRLHQERDVQELFRHDLQVDATLSTFGAFLQQNWRTTLDASAEPAMLLLEGPAPSQTALTSRIPALSAFTNDVVEAIATCAVEYAVVEFITDVLNQMDVDA